MRCYRQVFHQNVIGKYDCIADFELEKHKQTNSKNGKKFFLSYFWKLGWRKTLELFVQFGSQQWRKTMDPNSLTQKWGKTYPILFLFVTFLSSNGVLWLRIRHKRQWLQLTFWLLTTKVESSWKLLKLIPKQLYFTISITFSKNHWSTTNSSYSTFWTFWQSKWIIMKMKSQTHIFSFLSCEKFFPKRLLETSNSFFLIKNNWINKIFTLHIDLLKFLF